MYLFLALNQNNTWLVTPRGMVQLPDSRPINSFKEAGVPVITFDDASMRNLQAIFKPAP